MSKSTAVTVAFGKFQYFTLSQRTRFLRIIATLLFLALI
jgi:hypothetical protein